MSQTVISAQQKQIMGGSGCIFQRVIRERLTEQVMLERRSEGIEKASHKDNRQRNDSGRRNSKCKGPEVRPWESEEQQCPMFMERSEQRKEQ